MKEYIDSLDSIIQTQFGYEEHKEITDGHLITRKKKVHCGGQLLEEEAKVGLPRIGRHPAKQGCGNRAPKKGITAVVTPKKVNKAQRFGRRYQNGRGGRGIQQHAATET
eukprot:12834667-Ditylum_brightwellii.AAC.2